MPKKITLTHYASANTDHIGKYLQYEVRVDDRPMSRHVRCYFDQEGRRLGWAVKGQATLHQNWRTAAKAALDPGKMTQQDLIQSAWAKGHQDGFIGNQPRDSGGEYMRGYHRGMDDRAIVIVQR